MNRKELKDAYKQQKFKMGVFQIRNAVNQKILVESSINLDAIWNRYRFALNMGGHPNTDLQKEWKEFGEDNFAFEVLAEVKEQEDKVVDYKQEAKTLGEMFIEELQPFGERGYHKR